jgi:ankyrin repeat protein
MYAASSGHLETVRYLVEQGAGFDAINEKNGMTPLGYAATGGHLETARFLVDLLELRTQRWSVILGADVR